MTKPKSPVEVYYRIMMGQLQTRPFGEPPYGWFSTVEKAKYAAIQWQNHKIRTAIETIRQIEQIEGEIK